MNKEKIALKSGYYFMIFNKDEIPFFDELKKTEKIVLFENNKYYLYEAPTWTVAQKIDTFMDQKRNYIGESIDDYEYKKEVII